jgi:hypothetical protein
LFAYLILGIGLFLAMVLMANWYASADTRALMKVLKWGVIALIICAALFFLITGRLGWAFMALPALLPWFLRLRVLMRAAKTFSRMTGGFRSANQTSDVETPTVRMSLDHETGDMTGEVLNGPFAGRRVEKMTKLELLTLLQSCQTEDEDAARLIESYLDRHFSEWRDEGQRADHTDGGARTGTKMDRAEAFMVLGLEAGASDDLIKEAHRRLIAGLHPDHGGSDYLAAQINQAKDLLLKG